SPGFKPMAQRGLLFRRSWVRCSWGPRPASQGTNVSSFSSAESSNTIVFISAVEMDEQATALLAEDQDQVIRLIAHRPRIETEEALDQIDREVRNAYHL